MAAIPSGRANDERVKCLRIFSDNDGETHMEDIDIKLQPRNPFKDNPALRLSDNLPPPGTTSATSRRAWVKWNGTIRRFS